jgi:hypothetical protein
MANANAPMGLIPRRYRNGSPWMGVARHYFVPASDATPLFIGDPVVIVAGVDLNGFASVTRATAGGANRITGVVTGFRPSATIIANGYRAASTAEYVIVCDDPEILFEIQESAATDGAALTAAAMGKNISLLAGAGNTFTKQSGFQIDSTTAATTATLQLRIVESERRIDNTLIGAGGTAGAAYAKWLVAINQPTETGNAGATGV